MSENPFAQLDAEAINDRLALEHPSDDYYARSPWAIRLIENRRLRIIRKFMGQVDGLSLAEVGSGGGHVLRMFPTARLTAIDVSGVYLDIARRNLEGFDVTFLKGEVHQLNLPDESFDRIICTEVLEHVVDPETVLATIGRLLRPSGIAVITVPNDPLILWLKAAVRRCHLQWLVGDRIEWGGDTYHLHRWTPKEFERLLSHHLRVVRRRSAPLSLFPVRACFKCVPLAAPRRQ